MVLKVKFKSHSLGNFITMKTNFIILLCAILSVGNSYKILGIFPFGSKSHYGTGEGVLKALNDAGHEVTMISVFDLEKPRDKYHQIKISDFMEEMQIEGRDANPFEFANMNALAIEMMLYEMGALQAEHVFKSKLVQELLNSNQKFDAVIVEIFAIDSLMGFGQHFNCPVIGVNTFDGVYWNDVFTGNQSPFSYVPLTFLGLPDNMTFQQRLSNTVYSLVQKFLYSFYHLRNQRKIYEKHFPKATKSFDDVHRSMSILFMNSHLSSSSSRPYLPNMIQINGIHLQPSKPLPDDIQKFLDSATEGAIIFTMGSMVRSVDWTIQQREASVNTFAKINQKVLWKYENETLPGNPGNIRISSWLPQRDALAHPNVKVFITHGGNLGTTEALSEGVPLLGIPLFGDQMVNLNRAIAKGYALGLNFKNITEENFSRSLNKLLKDKSFSENAKKLSNIFHDRPLNSKETVVYYTEYAIRHNGAEHLRISALQLNYLAFHLIDVYATLFAGGFAIFYVFYKISTFSIKRKPRKQKKQ